MLRRQFRKARRANSVRAHGNILNLTYEYVYRAYEFKWRRRLWRVFETVWSEQLLCSLESFVPYEFTRRFTEFEVFRTSILPFTAHEHFLATTTEERNELVFALRSRFVF